MIKAEVSLPWAGNNCDQITGWCNVYVGIQALTRDHVANDRPWYVSSYYDTMIWHFAREEDATLFRLKWVSK